MVFGITILILLKNSNFSNNSRRSYSDFYGFKPIIMKNKINIILTLLFSLTSGLYAQSTFQKTLSSPEDQIINCVTEDDYGNFIMVGRKNATELGITQAYLIRLDPLGELLDEVVLDTTQGSSMLFNVFFFNDSLFLLGSKYIDPVTTKLMYLKLDKNLVKIDEKHFGIPANSWFSYMNSIIDSDSNFVITGYNSRWDTVSNLNNDVFFYKLSLMGDSINSKFISSEYPLSLSFDILEKNDQSGYYSYGFKYSTLINDGGQIYDLSTQFDSLNILGVPFDIDTYISSEKLNDSIIIISGNGEPPEIPSYSLSVLTTTVENDPIDYNHFKIEGDMRDHTAMYQGVSNYYDNTYVGGTSNFNYANPFFSTSDSWFHLVKVNPDLTPIWENWYGGDAYYFLYSILATSDGGCLMVGNRYDYEIQEQERDIHVVKVNSEGLIVWTQEIRPDQHMFSIYPNPGSNQINLKMPAREYDFELFGLNGQVLIKQQVNIENNTINTSNLRPEMYFYRISDTKSKIIQTGKWIKQ
jgi:hypothetical protein